MNNRKISVVIPYYNRSDLIKETLSPLLSDHRIDDIVLCDDRSKPDDFKNLLKITEDIIKVRVTRNCDNFGNQHNKKACLSFAKNEWAIILDNDNIVGTDFIDKLYEYAYWDENTIYHPDFAYPNFNYRHFGGKIIREETVKSYCSDPIFMTLLNTNNYFVNVESYLESYVYDKNIKGADGIFFAYNWMKDRKSILVVNDMQYFHRVHDGSCFLANTDINMKLINFWLNKVKNLNNG